MSLKFKHIALFSTSALTLALSLQSSLLAAVNADSAKQTPEQSSLTATTSNDSQFSTKQQKRLDMLFTRLASSDDESAAKQLVAEIWSIWKDPVDTELLLEMTKAEQLFTRGKRKEAFAVLDEAVQDYPGYSEIWNQRATYYYFDGRYEDSLNDIAKVLELEPRHFGAMSGKIAILMRDNRLESALKTLQQALKVNPFMPERHMLKPRQDEKKKPKGLAI